LKIVEENPASHNVREFAAIHCAFVGMSSTGGGANFPRSHAQPRQSINTCDTSLFVFRNLFATRLGDALNSLAITSNTDSEHSMRLLGLSLRAGLW
jgi:hypothetical protein